MKKLSLSLLFITSFISAQAQWGVLDSTFGNAGIVTTDLLNEDQINSIALQPDGKIVAGGICKVSGIEDFAIARYKSNGSLDSSFGINGKVTMGVSGTPDMVRKVLIQADGKIVVVGHSVFDEVANEDDFFIMRLKADGSLDSTFGTNGKTYSPLAQGGPDYAYSAALQPDGKIVVGGNVGDGTGGAFGVVRYKTNGTLDSTFGTNGVVLTDFDNNADYCFTVNIQSDGKIIASGYVYDMSVSRYKFGAARYNANGSLDNTFDGDGKLMTEFGTLEDVCTAAAIQADGKIVLAGYTWTPAMKTRFAVARYNTNGTLDNTFGIGGKVTNAVDTGNHWTRAITIQPDGKIILAGQVTIGINYTHHFALLRYNTDGTLDNTWGNGGIVITAVQPDYSVPQSLALQPDNKVVVGGVAGFASDFALARYLTGPALGVLHLSQDQTELLIYPNPVQSGTTLEYMLEQDEHISITIKDVQGRTVQTVAGNQLQAKGLHKLPLSLSPSLPAGNYFVILASATGSTAIQVTK
jgi:uncharacterized delta-60 repeat protein